jgi:hypothetical protein
VTIETLWKQFDKIMMSKKEPSWYLFSSARSMMIDHHQLALGVELYFHSGLQSCMLVQKVIITSKIYIVTLFGSQILTLVDVTMFRLDAVCELTM